MIVREGQIETFKSAATSGFEQRLTEHLKALFPRHYSCLGDAGFNKAVGSCIEAAKSRDFVTEIGVCRFSELVFYFGIEFDRDPQTAWARPLLTQQNQAESMRSKALHDEGMRQWQRIAGPENRNVRAAFGRLQGDPLAMLNAAAQPRPEVGVPKVFHYIFPEKAEAVGAEALQQLVRIGRERSHARGFVSTPAALLFSGLGFALGAGFDRDPALSWAERVVTDETLRDEPSRAKRLLDESRAFLRLWTE